MWEIWQLAPHHEYNVLFLIVLGAATQHFTRGGFATSCLHFSAPFEVVQTHRQTQTCKDRPVVEIRVGSDVVYLALAMIVSVQPPK